MASPTTRLLDDLLAEGLLPSAQAAAIAEDERTRPFSLHYELRALLYLGIVLFTGGVGVLVYQHIDTIGHQVIIAVIALAMSVSFTYAARKRPAFTWAEAPRTSIAADYLLLLSCLLFLILEGYLQVQYGIFGHRYGLATVLPAGLFLYLAYGFDHRGVLGMAITALAAWVGVSAAPMAIFSGGGFPSEALSGPGLLLGLALLAVGLASERLGRKAHFGFTYVLLGSNMALLAAMVRLFEGGGDASMATLLRAVAVALLVLGICTLLVWYARRTQSYLFLLLAVAYGYVAFTSILMLLVIMGGLGDAWPLLLLYLPLSLMGVVLLFVNIKKILRLV